MRLRTQHLFFLLLGVLMLAHLGMGVREYFENAGDSADADEGSDSSALPPGIPRSEIPTGDEDLYILKSEIVPPVCPKCPDVSACPKPSKCPPCPPCGRCEEPAFECKKVPNYKRDDDRYLPRPVLTDFSQFGI